MDVRVVTANTLGRVVVEQIAKTHNPVWSQMPVTIVQEITEAVAGAKSFKLAGVPAARWEAEKRAPRVVILDDDRHAWCEAQRCHVWKVQQFNVLRPMSQSDLKREKRYLANILRTIQARIP